MKILRTLQHWFSPQRDSAVEATPLAEEDDPFTEPVVWEIRDSIDLHHVAPREIKAVVTAYLEEAQARGFKCVRLIHGKGIGVQRNVVRNVLARSAFVTEFHDAPDQSGWGATVAYLSQAQSQAQKENDGEKSARIS